SEDTQDQNLPLMLWYAIEPIAAQEPAVAVRLAEHSRIPLVRQYIARRLAEDLNTRPAPIEALLQTAAVTDTAAQLDIFRGLAESLHGWHKAPKPAAWEPLRTRITTSIPIKNAPAKLAAPSSELLSLTRELGVIFGDPWAL